MRLPNNSKRITRVLISVDQAERGSSRIAGQGPSNYGHDPAGVHSPAEQAGRTVG